MLSGGTIEYISVIIDNDDSVTRLAVEEFHPYEPSAYVHEAGWTCFDGDNEYFVSKDSGLVYGQREHDEQDRGPDVYVGIAPEIKAAADKMQRQMEDKMQRQMEGVFNDEERYGR